DTTDFKVKLINGSTPTLIFRDGWSGSFMFDRQDSAVDDYIAQLEADYFLGIQHPGSTITETITEVNGSVTQYRYTRCVFKLSDAGSWKGDSTVKMALDFMAERRLKIA